MKTESIINIKEVREHEAIDLKVIKNNNFILENGIITHNCGKSHLIKNIMAQVFQLGESITVVSDPRMEQRFASTMPKKSENLPKHMMPVVLPIISYLPEYAISRFYGKLPHDIDKKYIFNYELSDVEINDMETLLNLDRGDIASSNAHRTLSEAWMSMRKKLKKEYPNRRIENLSEAIVNVKESIEVGGFSHRYTKNKLIGDIKRLQLENVFGEKKIDPIVDLRAGRIPVLSNKYSNRLQYDKCYAAIWMRKLFDSKTESLAGLGEKLKPVWVIADEMQTVCAKNSSSSQVLTHSILRQGRQLLLHFLAATQSFGHGTGRSGVVEDAIDPSVLSYIDDLIIFRLNNPHDLNHLCSARGIAHWDSDRKRLENLESNKKLKHFEMAHIDSDGNIETFYNYSLMTGHVPEKV